MTDAFAPADRQTRCLALLIGLIIYAAVFHGLGGAGVFLAMIYIVFRDGRFGGQSVGKKATGIRVVHADGREISFVDSSFRNVLFIIPLLLPPALVVEAVALFRHPGHLLLGDRIADTRVVRKSAAPVLA